MRVFPFDEREIVLRADFSRVEEGDVLSVPIHRDFGPRAPHKGEAVYLLDGNGNGCVALCRKLRDGVARMLLVLDTWTGPDEPPGRRRVRTEGGVHQTVQAMPSR
jgi:hypothetical protein